ncbi:MAG: hypothetical protein WC967_13545 [Balneolaceae bacterium]
MIKTKIGKNLTDVEQANRNDNFKLRNYLKNLAVKDSEISNTIKEIKDKYKYCERQEVIDRIVFLEVEQRQLRSNIKQITGAPIEERRKAQGTFYWSQLELNKVQIETIVLKYLIKEIKRQEHIEQMKAEQVGRGSLNIIIRQYLPKDKADELAEELSSNFYIRSVI